MHLSKISSYRPIFIFKIKFKRGITKIPFLLSLPHPSEALIIFPFSLLSFSIFLKGKITIIRAHRDLWQVRSLNNDKAMDNIRISITIFQSFTCISPSHKDAHFPFTRMLICCPSLVMPWPPFIFPFSLVFFTWFMNIPIVSLGSSHVSIFDMWLGDLRFPPAVFDLATLIPQIKINILIII